MNKVATSKKEFFEKNLGNKWYNNSPYICASLQKILNEIEEQLSFKSPATIEENDDSYRKEIFSSVNQQFYYHTNKSSAEYWKSDNSHVRNDEYHQDFYRVSSQDDRFESGSIVIQEYFNRLINGFDYYDYSYRKVCLKYIHFRVRAKKIFMRNHDSVNSICNHCYNQDDKEYDQYYNGTSHSYNCSTDEENNEEEISKSSDREGNEIFTHTKRNSKTASQEKVKSVSRIEENKRQDKLFSFHHRVRSHEKTLTVRNTATRRYSKNQKNFSRDEFVGKEKWTIEKTLKMSTSSSSVEIRSRSAMSINGVALARAKRCASSELLGESADEVAPVKYTCGADSCFFFDDIFYACESIYMVIDACVQEVTWQSCVRYESTI